MKGKPILTEYKGKMHSLKELCEITGLSYKVMYDRYCRGERGDILCRSCYEKVCKICGKEFAAIASNTKCCSDECKKENELRNQKVYREKQKYIKAEKKETDVKPKKKLTVTDIAVMARKAGMSYGQYVARMGMS